MIWLFVNRPQRQGWRGRLARAPAGQVRGDGKGGEEEECWCVSEVEPMGVSAGLDVGERGKSSEQLGIGAAAEGGTSWNSVHSLAG